MHSLFKFSTILESVGIFSTILESVGIFSTILESVGIFSVRFPTSRVSKRSPEIGNKSGKLDN